MPFTSSGSKEAYLRKHGGGRPRTNSHEEPTSPPTSPRSPVSREASGELSWAQKRKESLQKRAGMASPRNSELQTAKLAVQFAAKLKIQAQKKKEMEEKTGVHEESWKERRMKAFMATHNGRKPDAEMKVSATAVLFAAKLKLRAKNTSALADISDADTAHAGLSGPPTPKAKKKDPNAKSWTQLRKEAFMKKYGRQRKEEAASTDVAVSAVKFAAKLKQRVANSPGGMRKVEIS